MKIITFTLITFISIGFWFKDFEIIEAESQKWYGGRQESGYGTYYNLKLITKKKSENIKFEYLWVGENSFEIKAFKRKKNLNVYDFDKNDTLFIKINDRIIPENNRTRNKHSKGFDRKKTEKKIKPPYKYKGEALIGYSINGKQKYKEIKKFTTLKPFRGF